MKINPHAPLFAAVAAEATGLGKASAATGTATPPPAPADSAPQKKTPDPLMAALPPAALKVLKERLANKTASDTETTPPPAKVIVEDEAKAKSAAAAETTPQPKPKEAPKQGDEVKNDEPPDAGVIDFTKLKPKADPDGEDGPAALTEAELADLKTVQGKLTEAHKDNAAQRKLKREALEAKEKLEKDIQALNEQLEAARAEASAKASGDRYLDRFSSPQEVEYAREDALATLRQLQDNPEAEIITLPGDRKWKMINSKGEHIGASAAETAFEILEDYDGKIKQLGERTSAEKVVSETLPLLKSHIPELEKDYKELMAADWRSKAPEISLDAALGRLVRLGQYTMVPAGKQASQPAPAAKKAAAPPPELPNTQPPVREAKPGEKDVSHLKARAFKGDSKALEQWIKQSGKTQAAA